MNHAGASRLKVVPLGTLLLVSLVGLHLMWLIFGWGGETHRVLLGNVLLVAPSLVAAIVALIVALKHQAKVRRGWLFIGLGLAALSIGDSIWAYLELVPKTEPFPSSADLFYLMFGPLLAAGLLQLMPPPCNRLEGLRLGLDLAITVGAVGLYFWRYLLAPPLTWSLGSWGTGITLAYPLLDLLLLSLLLLIVMREQRGTPPRLEFVLMGLGIAAQVAGDLFYNAAIASDTYYSGHPIDALWTLSAALIVLAAYASLAPPGHAVVGQRVATLNGYLTVATPYLAVTAGFVLLLVTETDPTVDDSLGARGVLYGTVVVTLLVVLRQLLAFSENWRLAKDLARQSETLERRVRERTAELEALSRRYRHDALHDALTGLPNRAHFQKRLQEAVRQEHPFAALYLDFDRFKAVNDSFGHTVGDALLVAIGARLEGCMRPGDLVARLGGDEFAVLLESSGVTEAVQVAERLTQAFQAPLRIAEHTLYATTSIGVVTGKGSDSAENVLRDADIAMYRAKALGRSRFVVFEPAMRESLQTRLALEADLRRATERGELEVYYQPVVRVANGTIAGFEALVRWRHPECGLIPPADFIPLAEEDGLITEIDRWVLKTACAQLRAWDVLDDRLAMGVNLSSHLFNQTDLAPFIAAVLAETGLQPHRLKLELTESLLMDTSAVVRETLASLRDLGVRLHIDDFGTGYSSLSYLQRFDADLLKIDCSFIAKLLENEDSAELVRTIVNMAHNLEMKVVAEGVETKAQFARLRALGCEYAQGYLFSKPVPAAAVAGLLQSTTAVA